MRRPRPKRTDRQRKSIPAQTGLAATDRNEMGLSELSAGQNLHFAKIVNSSGCFPPRSGSHRVTEGQAIHPPQGALALGHDLASGAN